MQAEAFATAMAEASTCGCDVSISAQASVWDEIWVEAVANAYAETCVGMHILTPLTSLLCPPELSLNRKASLMIISKAAPFRPRSTPETQCAAAVGNDYDFVTDFDFAVSERMVTATARAIAEAVAIASEEEGNMCLVSLDVCAANSPQCVRNQCGGSGFEFVMPCCNPDHRCVVQSERRFLCRHRNARIPSFWDGRIAECNLPLPQ